MSRLTKGRRKTFCSETQFKAAATRTATLCDFTRGFACAAAILAYEEGYTGSGYDLLRSGGFRLEDLEAAGVDPSDIEHLKQDSPERS
jgi:hypothetical protein